jgi:phosphoribosylaminoimidazole carboxylase (NCAIR synthetase)
MRMGQRIGVIGGGQLARMMIPAATNLGFDISVLAEMEHSSAHLAASVVGDYRDIALVREFAKTVDVITFDHEHVPAEILDQLREDGGVVALAALLNNDIAVALGNSKECVDNVSKVGVAKVGKQYVGFQA